jgi:hypothetical protein
MNTRPLWLLPWLLLACRTETGPNDVPDAPPAFRGTIAQIPQDSVFVIDDGSASACGFSIVRVNPATPLWWRVGGRAVVADLQIGRTVSLWSDGAAARCRAVDASAVVIEQPRP